MNLAMNSSALIMKPKPEFLEWMSHPTIVSSLSTETQQYLQSQTLASMRANATIISIPLLGINMNEEANKYTELYAAEMLEAEFQRWGVPLELRPKECDASLLRSWFDISYHTRIFSLE
jgi:hypothetical protein